MDNFFALLVGIAGSETFGLRGPGRFMVGLIDISTDVGVMPEGAEVEVDATGGVFSKSGERHTGHFFASGESTATSTTSLADGLAFEEARYLALTQHLHQQNDSASPL